MQHANDTVLDCLYCTIWLNKKTAKSADYTILLIYIFDTQSEKLELLDIEKVQLKFMEQVLVKNGFLSY